MVCTYGYRTAVLCEFKNFKYGTRKGYKENQHFHESYQIHNIHPRGIGFSYVMYEQN
jgi:hypothetical protein